jgi:hypothetical protein
MGNLAWEKLEAVSCQNHRMEERKRCYVNNHRSFYFPINIYITTSDARVMNSHKISHRLLLLRLLFMGHQVSNRSEAWSAYVCVINEALKNLVTSTSIILKGVLEIYDPNGESCVHSAQGSNQECRTVQDRPSVLVGPVWTRRQSSFLLFRILFSDRSHALFCAPSVF